MLDFTQHMALGPVLSVPLEYYYAFFYSTELLVSLLLKSELCEARTAMWPTKRIQEHMH